MTGPRTAELRSIAKIRYGKGLGVDARDSDGAVPVYGSAGILGYHTHALVTEPTIVVGRKGNAGAVHIVAGPSWPIDTTYYLELSEDVDIRYLGHQLISLRLGRLDSSTAIPSLRREDLEAQRVTLETPERQVAIVEEIEKQFTRLEAAAAALQRARTNLKEYHASILETACSGGLVPSSAELAPTAAGWRHTVLGEILREPLRNGHSAKRSPDGAGVRTLTLTAVTAGDFSEKNTKITDARPDRVEDLWIAPGDIFVERSNTPELVGTARMYRGSKGIAIFPDLLIRVRVDESQVLAPFAELLLQTQKSRRHFQRRAQGIAGTMPKIDQQTIREVPFLLPPLDVQGAIVEEVERRLSLISALQNNIAEGLRRAEALRQSILSRAFSGRLL